MSRLDEIRAYTESAALWNEWNEHTDIRGIEIGSWIYGLHPRGRWLFVTVRKPVPLWRRAWLLCRHRIRIEREERAR